VPTDMAAFKAANPGASLEDFVQSQSPEHRLNQSASTSNVGSASLTDTSGRREIADLSSEPGMWWRRMWDNKGAESREIQKPPFDHIREAEKVGVFCFDENPFIETLFIYAFDTSANSVHLKFTYYHRKSLSCLRFE